MISRRWFLTAPALASAVGVKAADLPDLTIKEVKAYVTAQGKLASVVTNSGIEGNYTLGSRYWHPDWNNEGWVEFSKRVLVGKNALDRPAFTSQWTPSKRRRGQSSYASAIDNCLWDIAGKVTGLPVYRLLGAYRDKVPAYASSQHLNTLEALVEAALKSKAEGFHAFKLHPPELPPNGGSDYKLDIAICRALRKALGDDFHLLMDPVGVYTRQEAMAVGRVLDELKFTAFEDPLPTSDIEGLAELCRALDTPIHAGEFIFSMYDYAEYLRRGAVDVVRFIVDNVGGITGGMKIAAMAECFGLECAPHNWGDTLDHAVHFHCELAMPNDVWFEMTIPQGVYDHPWMKDRIRVAADGFVHAPTKPGLGYEIDHAELDRATVRVER
ncbi:MAG: mandelate racemase/muconate lactonizing enzyme family protein [Acidobacteria bacterium]|nr:mandelate racemase/muconate lactonizing enzyme family protein [Acidobacteriota bacterium]